MKLYIVGVTKYNPLETVSAVQGKILGEIPSLVPGEPLPNVPELSNFAFNVPDSDAAPWRNATGKFMDIVPENFL